MLSLTWRATVGVVRSRRGWLAALVGAALLVVLVIGAVVWTRSGAADASSLVRAADRFTPPADWRLVEQTVRESGSVCVDVACPSVDRRWTAGQPPTAAQLQTAMAQAGWSHVNVDGDCQPRSDRTGAFPLCQAQARAGDGRVELSVAGPQSTDGSPYAITLTISG